jgi:Rieske Fe-S protein
MAHDFVVGSPNPWKDVFDPGRKSFKPGSLTTWLGENADYPMHFVLDRLRKDRKRTVQDIAKGDGAVIVVGGKTAAVHRTDSGTVVAVSPVCTHMGCHVRWNKSEHTWDCPCHGSRFTPEGLVLGGPAEQSLEKVPIDD